MTKRLTLALRVLVLCVFALGTMGCDALLDGLSDAGTGGDAGPAADAGPGPTDGTPITGLVDIAVVDEGTGETLCEYSYDLVASDRYVGFLSVWGGDNETQVGVNISGPEDEPVLGLVESLRFSTLLDGVATTQAWTTDEAELTEWQVFTNCTDENGELFAGANATTDGPDLDGLTLTLDSFVGESAILSTVCPAELGVDECELADGRMHMLHTVEARDYEAPDLLTSITLDLDIAVLWSEVL